MPTKALKQLKAHPAQMRTTYDLDALAALTLQVFARGLDAWQPIVATPNGDSFHIVSGHRRHMAHLLAFALRDWAKEHPETIRSEASTLPIEVVRTMLTTLVESFGSLDLAVSSLLAKYGHEEIPFVTFEGSQKAQILALHAANYGSDQPDMLGIAHSFQQAVVAGATPEEIARNVGQPIHYVSNHLALAAISPELAQCIAAGELPISVAAVVADLPEPKRSGLTIFILANLSAGSGQAGKLTAKAIKECATTLKKWPGLQQPLLVKHQSQRNIARTLVRLWGQVVEAYPEDAYAAAAMLIYRSVHEEPWANQEKLALWFQVLGGDIYFTDGRIHWTNVVTYLLTEVVCETCPIAQLPKQQLRSDLSQGQGGPLGMPCRSGETAIRCIHGLAPNDSFDVRVPWEWSQHPGVVGSGGDYRIKSCANLLTAWQAQATKEQAEDEVPVAADTEKTAVATATTPQAQTSAPPQPDRASALPDSPIVKQRTQIADFMQRHEQLDGHQGAAHHPFATPCGRCRHRLESSPTQDESVPHCAWAGRLRRVSFQILAVVQSGTKDSLLIPVCHQFAPNQPWFELIPAHPEPPSVPRDWLKEQILHLAGEANRHGSRNAFTFLTGRPMGSNENYSDWFGQQLDAQGGDLSDAQLFTLFVWAHTEWQRAKSSSFSLPLNGHGMQFVTVGERPWRTDLG